MQAPHHSVLVPKSGVYKVAYPSPLGEIESICWGRKSIGEEMKGGKREEGKGKGREEERRDGVREWKREEGKGKGRGEKGSGRGSEEGSEREDNIREWESGEGNQIIGNFIHPCSKIEF